MGRPSAAETNTKMAKYAPELASSYAKYPLKRARWLPNGERGPKGEPLFLQAETANQGVKMDYVFGPGPQGRGYYHLLTRKSYIALYVKLRNQSPMGACACTKDARQNFSDFDDVKKIVYNRSVASKPDDAQAAKDAISQARQTAQGHYNNDQNLQIGIGVVQTGINLSN
uniref:Uncharacterized protein n=1 Tax=Attheya septentrionalis TaxID=420275 RepID=A0A7S2URI4_9STRA|mmetsp:Transcript_9395/g.17021  ORF Transcript_9395/g.17021 Transcript_9395/m.17021 type:complete len:170 (+) Transcript_9395:88-597(+)